MGILASFTMEQGFGFVHKPEKKRVRSIFLTYYDLVTKNKSTSAFRATYNHGLGKDQLPMDMTASYSWYDMVPWLINVHVLSNGAVWQLKL